MSISYAVFCLKKKILEHPHPVVALEGRRMYVEATVQALVPFNDAAAADIYTLSLHDALPISSRKARSELPRPEVFRCDPRSRNLLGYPTQLDRSRPARFSISQCNKIGRAHV